MADFDPDAYLAEKTGSAAFDPDAYLKAKTGGGREPSGQPTPPAPEKQSFTRGGAADKAPGVSDILDFVAGNVYKGGAMVLGAPQDTATNIKDMLTAGYGLAKGAMGSKDLPELTDRSQQQFSSEGIIDFLKNKGIILPGAEPTSPQGALGASALQGGTAALFGGGRLTPGQVAGAFGSGALSGTGAQATSMLAPDNPALTQLGGVLPGHVGTAVKAPLSAGVRRMLVGNEAQQAKMRANITEANQAGVQQPSGGQITGNHVLAGAEGTLARLPGAGGVMDEAALKRQEGMRTRAEEIARGLHPAGEVSQEEAGAHLRTGIEGHIKNAHSEIEAAYAPVDADIHPKFPVVINGLRSLLREIAGPVRGAEATGKLLTNPLAAQVMESIETDLAAVQAGGKAEVSPQDVGPKPTPPPAGSTPKEKRAYHEALAQYNAKVKAAQQAADRANQAPETRTRELTQRKGDKLQTLERKIEVERPYAEGGRPAKNSLPFATVQKLRSKIGRALAEERKSDGPSVGLYEAMYEALSDDVRGALPPKQRADWEKATAFAKQINERVKNVMIPLLRAKTPEKAVTAAFSGTKEGASSFRQIMGALKPEQRNAMASHVLEKLGSATPGKQNAAGDVFSSETFLTNWNKMLHDDAKAALFPDPKTRAALDQLASVADKMREAGRGTHNPSGTARAVTHAGMAGGVTTAILDHLFSGHPLRAAGVAAGATTQLLGTRQLAKAMTSPEFIKWLAEGTKINRKVDVPRYLTRLTVIANQTQDPSMKAALDNVAADLSNIDIGLDSQTGGK
jgi:hypothetical protein